MIRIALVGDIGSGKTFISKLFKFPVFNADKVVYKIYSKNKKVYFDLKRKLPNFFNNFPVKKKELINAILTNKTSLKKISTIVHPVVRKELHDFIRRNYKKKAIILDIPLYFENKLNKKNDIIIFIQPSSREKLKRLKKRKNFNKLVLQKLKKIQLPLEVKKRKSHYVIKNNFKENIVRKNVENILSMIL